MNKASKKIVSSTLAALMVGGLAMSMTAPAQAFPTKIFPFPKPIPVPPPGGLGKGGGGFGWGKGGFGWGFGGLATGLALGAIASQSSADDACGFVHQRIYDEFGNFLGYRNISTC